MRAILTQAFWLVSQSVSHCFCNIYVICMMLITKKILFKLINYRIYNFFSEQKKIPRSVDFVIIVIPYMDNKERKNRHFTYEQ